MCFVFNSDLLNNQFYMGKLLKEIKDNQKNQQRIISDVQENQNKINETLNKILELLTHQHEDKGE